MSGQTPSVIGPRETACKDCGETIPYTLMEIEECSWLSVRVPVPHACPQREEREAAERAEAEAKAVEREAAAKVFRESPPASRVAEVFARCRLPADILPEEGSPGLRSIRYPEVDRRLVEVIAEHRLIWLRGGRPKKGLWSCGDTDLRKTLLAGSLAFDVAHRTPRRVLFWNVSDLMDNIRLAAQGKRNEYDPSAISDAELLVLDDLGTVKVTDTAWDRIFHIIESAKSGWGGTRPTQTLYVTSNEKPEDMIDRLSPPSDASGGERIVRRLRQICDLVEVGP
jgi:hypothetical protein